MRGSLTIRRRGSTLIEFALTSLIWLGLLTGTAVTGMNLIRSIQVVQICRDVGHMFAYGLDFSQPGNQNIIVRLANGLNFTVNGGNGVVILSVLTQVGTQQCTAAGLGANSTQCPNLGQTVFTRRLVVGKSSLRASSYGTPAAAIIGANGYIAAADYLKDSTARASNFVLLQLNAGDITYLTEAYFASPDLDWSGYMTGTGVYAHAIF
jgi:uncharacterized membrane protein